jgi:GTPase SAR1 family protein
MFAPIVLESCIAETRVDGQQVEVALWDTAGQEDERLRPLAYHNSHVILICYSIEYADSFENVVEKV